jgi:hypothetical protein
MLLRAKEPRDRSPRYGYNGNKQPSPLHKKEKKKRGRDRIRLALTNAGDGPMVGKHRERYEMSSQRNESYNTAIRQPKQITQNEDNNQAT